MSAHSSLLVAGFLVLGCSLVSSASVALFDSKQAAYLRPGEGAVSFDKANLAALTSAITGLLPGQTIDAALSHELERVLQPSAFRKPKAYVVLNVGGLTTGSLPELFSDRQHRMVDLEGEGCPAAAVVHALSRVASANPDVKMSVVDQAGLQNCKGNCVEQNLAAASAVCKSTVTAGSSGSLQGRLSFENGQSLDLQQQEDKLFAVELASIYAGLKGELDAVERRAALSVEQEDVEVYEITFLGLHVLADKYGKDSAVVEAARAAVLELLRWAVQGLDAAYGGDVVYQVSLLERAPFKGEGVSKLLSWKDKTRRQLLQASFPGTDETAQAKRFSSKAAGYGTLVLLVYFSMAALYCMCFMPFKQDTLLYGSKKEQ